MQKNYFQQRHNPKIFVSSIRPYSYDPKAKCPQWEDFLLFLTSGKSDVIKCIQLWCASIFYPQIRHEYFLWLTGLGKNGKSVFIEVLSAVVGEESVGHLTARQLAGKHELAGLTDKQLNVSMEFEKVSPTFVDVVKNLCSNEPVAINEKMKPVYDARLNLRLLFVSNSIPYVSDRSDGFWRRCLLVECKGRIADGHEDLSLSDKLKNEAPGIFNWLLEGLIELKRLDGKIPVPESIRQVVACQRRVMDPHREFLSNQLVVTGDDQWVPGLKEIYPRYRQWMSDRGQTGVLAWERLRLLLKEVYPNVEHTRRRHRIQGRTSGYSGISWKQDEDSKSRADELVDKIMSPESSASSSDNRDGVSVVTPGTSPDLPQAQQARRHQPDSPLNSDEKVLEKMVAVSVVDEDVELAELMHELGGD